MRTTRSRTLFSRSGRFASVCLFLALGLAVAIESQQLTQTVQRSDAPPAASGRSTARPASAVRTAFAHERAGWPPAAIRPHDGPPAWKLGFQWHYRWSDPRGAGTYIRAITDEESLDGMPHYVMQTGNRAIYWSKSDLSWLMEQVNGDVEIQAAPSYRKFVWPMEPGKTWVAKYHWVHPSEGKAEERFRRHRIVAAESVQVPAGTYDAMHVVVTDAAGKKVNEYWYAPEARWLVKERIYLSHGVRERELIYASLWPKASASRHPESALRGGFARSPSATSSDIEISMRPFNVRDTGQTSSWNPGTRSAISRDAG